MAAVVNRRTTRGGARLVAMLVVATVGLILWAAAMKRAGNEQGAGIAGAVAFFIGVWALLAGVTAGSRARSQRERELREQYPDEPWHWKAAWHDGVIQGGAKGEAMAMGFFALIFLGLSAPGVWAIPAEVRRGNWLILLVLLFWVVGLWMLAKAWQRWRHHRRLGTLVFHPEPLPGSWGGFVGGVIHIPNGAEVIGDVKLKLCNVRLTVSGSGKNRRTREQVLWETETVLDDEKLGNRARLRDVPVLFQVPRESGGPTDECDRENRVIWRLQIEAPLRGGGKLESRFEIPVFDRGETLAAAEAGAPLLAAEVVRRAEDFMQEAGVTETREAGVRVWRFHQPGVRGSAVGLAVMVLAFGAAAVFVPFWPIRLGFGCFTLLMLAMLPGLLWQRAELRLSERDVEVVRSSLRGRKVRRVARDEVADLKLSESMRSGEKRYLRLSLIGVAGVDPATPHPHEHFAARKARYRARKQPDDPAVAAKLRETPRFEIDVASYLFGTQAAERVRDHLRAAIIGEG